MAIYSLSDLIGVLFAGILIGFTAYRFWKPKLPISKDDARMLRRALSYCELDFKQNFRNGFPIANDPSLSVRFVSWPAVNVFVKEMMAVLDRWQ